MFITINETIMYLNNFIISIFVKEKRKFSRITS